MHLCTRYTFLSPDALQMFWKMLWDPLMKDILGAHGITDMGVLSAYLHFENAGFFL